MEKKSIQIKSWNRFLTRNLVVEPNVMGKTHKFSFGNAQIQISLPSKKQVDRSMDCDDVANSGSMRLVNGVSIPIEYIINAVDVEVTMGATVLLNHNASVTTDNSVERFSSDEQANLDRCGESHYKFATDAFKYWLSILRWVSGYHMIGRYEVTNNESGWTTSLHDSIGGYRIWGKTTYLKIGRRSAITLEHWKAASTKLRSSCITPVYLEIFYEAQEYFDRGEYRRAMIDLAVSCEVFIRSKVLERLPSKLGKEMYTKIEEMNISQYVRSFFPESLTDSGRETFKKVAKDMTSLFDARNKIMHMADHERATAESCSRFITAAMKLFDLSNELAKLQKKK